MPDNSSKRKMEETAVLVRSVENLMRKLVRFLVGRISLVKLQEMLRYIFVEEIENKFKKEQPTKNISLTQIALLSGLDTRTVTKIRNNPKFRQPFHSETKYLKEFVPGASIIDDWNNRTPYFDSNSGLPKSLNISGEKPSFESLFFESSRSRGVTYKSLLQRLIENKIVTLDKKRKKVRLVVDSYVPSVDKDKLGAIEIGFSALGNLSDTVTKNICSLERGDSRLYQRGAWTYRLNPENAKFLQSELNDLLEATDRKARIIITKFEEKNPTPEQLTAGVGLFYFEE